MHRLIGWLLWFITALSISFSAAAEVIRVGPRHALKSPSEAARVASDGDIVEIDAGEYRGDVAVWRQNKLVLRGVGGRAHLAADGAAAEGKAIWVIKGNDTTVEDIEFSGAHVSDRNGAGIRQEGRNLIVRRCYFHDNENGILGGSGDVLIEHSEFARNGHGDGKSHNMYIDDRTSRFTLRFSYSHHARVGHNVKSRAAENHILFNRIMDETDGSSSYLIDISNGGVAHIIGNALQQGKRTDNYTLISFAAEGTRWEKNALYVINNTMVNDFDSGIFVNNRAKEVTLQLVNNLIVGPGEVTRGSARLRGNVITAFPKFLDRAGFDFRLKSGSPAIDRGVDLIEPDEMVFAPRFQYRHPLEAAARPADTRIDAGAFEFVGKSNKGK